MQIRFTAAQWAAISIAAIIDGDPNPTRWATRMLCLLAGIIGPSDIDPVPHVPEEEPDGVL